MKKCCICGAKYEGWGNNPEPVVTLDSVECCDECNSSVVIPARMFINDIYRSTSLSDEQRKNMLRNYDMSTVARKIQIVNKYMELIGK